MAILRQRFRYKSPEVKIKILPMIPRIGAAQVVVLKKVVGIIFCICGVPGNESPS